MALKKVNLQPDEVVHIGDSLSSDIKGASALGINTVWINRDGKVVPMTAYEIISIFLGILALLMSFGSLIVALLAFLDKRNKRK